MKTLTTETSKAIVMAVMLPENIKKPFIFSRQTSKHIQYIEDKMAKTYCQLKPYADWQILGFPSELTDQQMESVVEQNDSPFSGGTYKNYDPSIIGYHATASESFASLLKKMGALTENPYGEEPKQNEERFLTKTHNLHMTDVWKKEHNQWQIAQQSVGKNWIILVSYK